MLDDFSTGLQPMSSRRLGRRDGASIPALVSHFAANGLNPAFVADFAGVSGSESYAVDGSVTDFSTALTHSRTGNATMVDGNGVLQTISGPRRNHHVWDGVGWSKVGYRHETDAATNLVSDSSAANFISVSGASNITSQDVAETALGVFAAKKLIPTSANGSHYFSRRSSPSDPSGFYDQHILKADGYSKLQLFYQRGFSSKYTARFDLAEGVVESGPGFIEHLGQGWYRCSIYVSQVATSNYSSGRRLYVADDEWNFSFSGDGVSGILLANFGLEESLGNLPTSIIPTSGATVTRAADTLTIPAASLPYDGTAMSGATHRRITYKDTGSAAEQTLFDWRSDSDNRITVTLDTSGANTGKVTLTVVKLGSSVSVSSTAELMPGFNVAAGIAWRVTTSEINVALNGSAGTAVSNTAGVPDVSAVNADLGGMGTLESEAMWGDDIGNAGIGEASS